MLLYAHHALGQTLYYLGNPPAGLAHIEKAVSLYDPVVHSALTARYTDIDAKVHCQGLTAFTLWKIGYPQHAMRRAKEVLEWAKQLSHPLSLVFAEYIFSAMHREQQRDARVAKERAETAISLCAEYGLPDWEAFMTIERGWAIAQQGYDEGIAQIHDSLETLRSRGALVERPQGLRLLAEACRALGKVEDGLNALNEALILIDEQENRRDEVEIRRLKGELLLQGGRDSSEATRCFQSAIEIARRQGARSSELRTTMSLASLLASQGCREEGRTMLGEIYNWFTEGFDTADLKEAKALLDQLAG